MGTNEDSGGPRQQEAVSERSTAEGTSPRSVSDAAARNKFTPGPWHIGPDYLDDCGYREIAIQAPNRADGVCTPASVVLQFPNVEGMQEANARLIAAAPDLYEALTEIIELAEEVAPEECPAGANDLCNDARCQTIGCTFDKITRARAALSKASA